MIRELVESDQLILGECFPSVNLDAAKAVKLVSTKHK
jgi:hypothetical protein